MELESHDRWNYERYALLPDDGTRHEVLAGVLYVTPSPRARHQRILVRLTAIFHTFVEELGRGEIFCAPFDVLLSDEDVVQPDLVYLSEDVREGLNELHLRGTPDFIVEILSPSNRAHDLERKRALYARYGVEEYWIVDPDAETVAVLSHPSGADFSSDEVHDLSDRVVESDRLSGLVVDLASLFR